MVSPILCSTVFYHFGHGLQQSEYYKGDEIDRLDEPICPDDFMRERMISENNINSTIVQPLKKGAHSHAIIDACHGGKTIDLMHLCQKEKHMEMEG
ncbi:hypothetical protein AAZX31_01G072200 [Glycine max]|uniref:Metacaspase-1 isoform B n=1 Tax=Glycine soja TaxID=3848 RepID=A0A445M092_GLYSO|nr:Metacaspase-1 isoform B [Glycine soja]